jgi:hypothetical protein
VDLRGRVVDPAEQGWVTRIAPLQIQRSGRGPE